MAPPLRPITPPLPPSLPRYLVIFTPERPRRRRTLSPKGIPEIVTPSSTAPPRIGEDQGKDRDEEEEKGKGKRKRKPTARYDQAKKSGML